MKGIYYRFDINVNYRNRADFLLIRWCLNRNGGAERNRTVDLLNAIVIFCRQ